nr:hypothetical protein [Blastocatellia bacterium]
MKFGLLFVLMTSLCVDVAAQSRSADVGRTAVVLDESLSLLRKTPSLYAETIQRMRRGRIVKIEGVRQADGVTFYRVTALPEVEGWVQS